MNHDDLPAYWQSLPRKGWVQHAACAGERRDAFFAYEGRTASVKERLCARCPVTDDCLAFAIRTEPEELRLRHGVFGGMTPAERHTFCGHLRRAGAPLHFRGAA